MEFARMRILNSGTMISAVRVWRAPAILSPVQVTSSNKISVQLSLENMASKLYHVFGGICLLCILFIVFIFRINNITMKLQLQTKATVPKPKPVLILFWSKFFGKQIPCPSSFCDNINTKNCSVPCQVTNDRNRAPNASVMIIHARDPYPLPPTQYSHIPLTLFTWENPVYTPMLSDTKFLANINYLMSYRPDVADFYAPSLLLIRPSIEPKPIPFVNKTGLIAAVFSNCETGRTAYLRELMKYIQVDSYGECLRNKQGLQARYAGDFKVVKTRMLRNYKFTIVFLNQDCEYFVDDQLIHALNAGTIPVFMGTDKVDKQLGGNLRESIIQVRHFETPKILAEYLTKVSKNETLYNTYLKWKYEGFQFPESFLATPQGRAISWPVEPPMPYCSMCETIAVHRDRGQFKSKGSVKPEYCSARKIQDWLKV